MFLARGYAVPKGVDRAVKEKIMAAFEKAINDPEVVNKLNEMGAATDFMKDKDYYNFLKNNIDLSKQIYGIK